METVRSATWCPVCGYKLDFVPWIDGVPADEMCPCCGIQFGYDDACGGNVANRELLYLQWRADWRSEGMPWKSKGISAPSGWNPARQLTDFIGSTD